MRVLLPAPFSPSRQWICPGSMTRSMWSLATRDPKRLVMPRSSIFTTDLLPRLTPLVRASVRIRGDHRNGMSGASPDARRAGAAPCAAAPAHRAYQARSARRGLRLGLDLDLAVRDVRAHLLQLALDVGGHLGVEGVERREAG